MYYSEVDKRVARKKSHYLYCDHQIIDNDLGFSVKYCYIYCVEFIKTFDIILIAKNIISITSYIVFYSTNNRLTKLKNK